MANKETIQKWQEYIKDLKGQQIFLPDKFTEIVDKSEVMRAEYNKKLVQMAKEEIALNITTQNIFYDVRKYLSENGYPDIWVKEIGLNADALKDGLYIVTMTEQMR